MTKQRPSKLYHYTSIQGLASILKDRRVRLSPLDTLDDVSESHTKESVNFAQYIFVTCWTSLEEESIPFWHMYTRGMAGVRIELPLKMFEKYSVLSDFERGVSSDLEYCVLPLDRLHGSDYLVMPDVHDNFYEITYTDDSSLLYQNLVSQSAAGETKIGFGRLGKYKKKHWSFQSEWRYRLIILPSVSPPSKSYANDSYLDTFLREIGQVLRGRPLPFDEFFLALDQGAFQDMKVTLGPKHKPGDVAIVEALIKSYNPSANFGISELSGTVR